MKKKVCLCLFIAFSVSVSLLAQISPSANDTPYADAEIPVMSTKVSMEIDTLLFPKIELGTVFLSENPRAMIMPMVLRANFDSLDHKVLLQETAKELGVTVLKSGVLKHKGKIAYYVVGTTNDKERNVVLEVYYVKADAQRTIMITGYYEKEAKHYKKQLKKAAFSARIE
ncbi:MAG: hypothetical protein JXQ69_04915 [Paludibacteraceae bacterium]|nr:hypothetical protein [Paludibacteraceae bacterium]MBN2787650.1 hypothetical protein [Paludibacteraceae bacterium]